MMMLLSLWAGYGGEKEDVFPHGNQLFAGGYKRLLAKKERCLNHFLK